MFHHSLLAILFSSIITWYSVNESKRIYSIFSIWV